jgi:hypothetical protein
MQDHGFLPPVTADWLARQAAAGRVPEPDDPTPELRLTATSRLVLTQAETTSDHPACPPLRAPLFASLDDGDELRFAGAIEVVVSDGAQESEPRRFLGLDRSVIRAQAGPVDVVVRGIPDAPASVCPPGP